MAVLLHPMRATHDLARAGIRRGDRMYHVLSDIPGPEGGRELRTFVAQCGLRPEWVQFPGTYREHFDVHGRAVECLLQRGARLATNHDVGRLLAAKRAFAATAHTTNPERAG